jgi:CRISPR-associated endoribonuclease Cas6
VRLKLTLEARPGQVIPINNQHLLTAIIYTLLSKSNLQFASSLHDGNHISGNKKFKFFTFSRFLIDKKQISGDAITILSPEIKWFISSPWDEFMQYLVTGLLEMGEFRVGKERFPIRQVETMPDPFSERTELVMTKKCACMSPIVVTGQKEYKGKIEKYYYKPDDDREEISEKIRQNLIKKYIAFYGKEPEDTSLRVVFDQEYIKSGKAKVLVHYIKAGLTKQDDIDIKIPAILCPFTVNGSMELIRFGYECGFGEENSAGFGMGRCL